MEHTVSGKAIHLLGVSETCSCKARHVCQSCQGQDTVNAKLLAALEHTIDIFGDHVGSCSSYLCREDCPHHGDARPWSSAEEHDKAWTKPCDCVMKPIHAAIEQAKK